MDNHPLDELPVAVIGAGPIGLAAAAHLALQDIPFLLFEAGDQVGANIRDWGHVQLFSSWQLNVDVAATELLERGGWAPAGPAEYPTGASLVTGYLEPLAAVPEIRRSLRLGTRVVTVTRSGRDRAANSDRSAFPLTLLTKSASGRARIPVRAVIDSSGTWGLPNPLGADGLPADGEHAAADLIDYGIPDPLGGERRRYAGRRIAVVGSGHSAQTVVRDLTRLAQEHPATSITWAIRGQALPAGGGGAALQLPERARLVASARAAVDDGRVQLASAFRVSSVRAGAGTATLVGGDGRLLGPFDRVVAATGARPDLGVVSELQIDVDPVFECPRRIAPLIDPALHSCDTVPAHGAAELAHPEPGLFIVGSKSYGRAPTFLLATGHRQVRSVVAHLAGAEQAPAEPPAAAACSPAEAVGCGPITASLGCCTPAGTADRIAAS